MIAHRIAGVWLKWWSDVERRQLGLFISIYFLLGLGYCVGNGGYSWYENIFGPARSVLSRG